MICQKMKKMTRLALDFPVPVDGSPALQYFLGWTSNKLSKRQMFSCFAFEVLALRH